MPNHNQDTAQWRGPQFAPVCGVQMYEQMAIRNELPSYHLLLAHDILARTERYSAVFKHMRPGPRTIILDNSVVELKSPIIDPVKIAIAAKAVDANVIVLPDIYRDAYATVLSCEEAYQTWEPVFNEALGPDNYSFMMVPQGLDKHEFAKCAEAFADQVRYPKIRWWGIPRNQVETVGTRKWAIEACGMLNPFRDMHMLGFSDDVMDDLMMARWCGSRIAGIDSAVPLRIAAGKRYMSLSLTAKEVPPRPEGWLENGVYDGIVHENIRITNRLLGN